MFQEYSDESVESVSPLPNMFSPKCKVQVLRSLGLWSGSLFTETSICQAYLSLIEQAEHFIYIENQVSRKTV